MDVADVQRRLRALDYDLGSGGPSRDGVDGDFGPRSIAAALEALETGKRAGHPTPDMPDPSGAAPVPPDWMPAAKMARIIVHWSAGAHKASALDRTHYHIMIEGDGTLVRGSRSIRDNEDTGDGAYAAHTLSCNEGSIGVSLCCMAGAVESPFSSGTAPMTRVQWDALPGVLADLCRRYAIPVTPRTVLSHAEVQGTLGITQRGKWDIARLSFDPGIIGAKACGDVFRARTIALLRASQQGEV